MPFGSFASTTPEPSFARKDLIVDQQHERPDSDSLKEKRAKP